MAVTTTPTNNTTDSVNDFFAKHPVIKRLLLGIAFGTLSFIFVMVTGGIAAGMPSAWITTTELPYIEGAAAGVTFIIEVVNG